LFVFISGNHSEALLFGQPITIRDRGRTFRLTVFIKTASTHGVEAVKQRFDPRPIDLPIDVFQLFEASVVFEVLWRAKSAKLGRGQLFLAHNILQRVEN
jgi:hypothetical protein